MGQRSLGRQGLSCRATFTRPNRKFALAWKMFHPWSTLAFDFYPELSIKLYRRCLSLLIYRPLNFYLYQQRCFQSEHLDLRRQSIKWNAVSLLSQKVEDIFSGLQSKECVCLKDQQSSLSLKFSFTDLGLYNHYHPFYSLYYYNRENVASHRFYLLLKFWSPIKITKCSARNFPSGKSL